MIDKCLKRLLFLRGLKSMARPAPAARIAHVAAHEAPMTSEVTRWSRSAQAKASWARAWPRRDAISFNPRSLAIISSLSQDLSNSGSRAARESSGTPSR